MDHASIVADRDIVTLSAGIAATTHRGRPASRIAPRGATKSDATVLSASTLAGTDALAATDRPHGRGARVARVSALPGLRIS
jgi:hypothetical protein